MSSLVLGYFYSMTIFVYFDRHPYDDLVAYRYFATYGIIQDETNAGGCVNHGQNCTYPRIYNLGNPDT